MARTKKPYGMAGTVWREHPRPWRARGQIFLLLLGCMSGVVLWGALLPPVPKHTVSVAAAVIKDVPVYFNGSGDVQAANAVEVHVPADGPLTDIAFHEGQDVHSGDVLAKIGAATVAAPIDGRIGIQKLTPGSKVRKGDTLAIITQLEPISVLFNLPQEDLPAVNAQMTQQSGKLTVLAYDADGKNLLDSGMLQLVDNGIDPATSAIRLKATFPNEKRLLWPGSFIQVRLLVDTYKNALVIPAGAVQYDAKKHGAVFIYHAGNVTKRLVTIALTEGPDAVVNDGINADEQVVTVGAELLHGGESVLLHSSAKVP
jgi:multidrug efflux pump subunit AcrA (membrane-fusion protein)